MHSQYLERIRQPAMSNYSSGISGILGSSGVGANIMAASAFGSLPDLKQAKRASLEKELFGA
jgi:hypothetical protein